MTPVDLAGSIAAIVLTLGFVVYVVREARRGAPERRAEDAAREHFARHGRWPDEDTA